MKLDDVEKIKKQVEDNIKSLEKQRVALVNEYQPKLDGFDTQLLELNNRLLEIKKYKKI